MQELQLQDRPWRWPLRSIVSSLLLAAAASASAGPPALAGPSASAGLGEQAGIDFFENRIRPVLVEHCYQCHNSSERREADLALDHREGIRAGGGSGPAIDVSKPKSSRILTVLRHEGDLRMPQDGPKLSLQVIADFEKWIEMGGPDPRSEPPSAAAIAEVTSWESIRAQRQQWWSFQPVATPAIPDVSESEWAVHPVDRFVRRRLELASLQPAPRADRRTLIRRLNFALIGLPPTPQSVNDFLADRRPGAYERVVDRLLASPRFGERWARHWMDWYRYAETHGSEGDPKIPNAWHYRDYLIRALNADIPYDQLVREHIAGDLLPNPRVNSDLGISESALGIGHYRFVEHGYAPTDALDELVRTTDNQIDVITKATMALTVSCARCHDHKFDPISQRDFYALFGIMTSCRPALVTVDVPAQLEKNKEALRRLKPRIKQAVARTWLDSLGDFSEALPTTLVPSSPEERKDKRAAKKWSPWQRRINQAQSDGLRNPLHAWVQIGPADADRIGPIWQELASEWRSSNNALERRRGVTYPLQWDLSTEDGERWFRHGSGLGSGLASGLASGSAGPGGFHIAPEGDQLIAGIYPAGVYTHLLSSKHSGHFSSPSFKVTSDALWLRVAGRGSRARYVMNHYARAAGPIYKAIQLKQDTPGWHRWDMRYWNGDRAHIELAAARDLPVEARGDERSWFGVTDVIAANADQPPPRDEPAEFIGPLFAVAGDRRPAAREDLAEWYVAALRRCIEAWRDATMTDSQARFLNYFVMEGLLPNTAQQLSAAAPLVAQYRRLEAEIVVPTRAPGVVEAEAADAPLFVRGNHRQPAETIPRRFLEALDARPYDGPGSGRLALAASIAAPENPLTSRVLVNRIWHYLFGRGIVASTDNFGRLGEQPTHPELLDYLASRAIESGYSIKSMIRLLVTSRTFQLESRPTAGAQAVDPENRLLSHMRVRRLEAEAIRDAILAVSGQLNYQMHGPPQGDDQHRRSVYAPIRRNSLHAFLQAFDAPVPFTSKGRRDVTNVPAQSLAMMNDPFVVKAAAQWGDSIAGERNAGDSSGPREEIDKKTADQTAVGLDEASQGETHEEKDDQARIHHLFVSALSRPPTAGEQAAAMKYVSFLRESGEVENPWRDAAQAVFAFKEFIYIP